MLWQEKAVRENLRNLQGKRVFFLAKGDQLTSAARDFLRRERVEILPAGSIVRQEKAEHMTNLNSTVLVPKTHPRIRFRGKVDTLESMVILAQLEFPQLAKPLGEILELLRRIIRCDVLEEPLEAGTLLGLNEEELRRRSHFPQDFYGIPHFMPSAEDGAVIAGLNRLRCAVRETELAAVNAYPEGGSIQKALNRLSSAVYLLMIQEKAKQQGSGSPFGGSSPIPKTTNKR